MRGLLWLRGAPLRSSRSVDGGGLISLRVHVLWNRGTALVGYTSGCLAILEELQTSLDMNIGGIEVRCTLIGVQCIGSLIVTRLVQCTKVIPHFRNVRV